MSAQTFANPYGTLTSLVQKWERRWRWQRTLEWVPRALLPGLTLGVILAVIALLRPFLPPSTIALITLAGMGLGAALCSGVIWLRQRSVNESARRFDLLFELDERVSTALELIQGVIISNEELTALQIEDAREHARAVHAGQYIPLRPQMREWALLAILAAALAVLLLVPNPHSAAAAQDRAVREAIEDASETLDQIIPQVASDPTLSQEERQMLLETLQPVNETLSRQGISPEEAFAALSEAETALSSMSELFNQRVAQAQAAANAASEALRQMGDSQSEGQNNSLQQLIDQLQQLSQQAPQMSPAQMQNMASQMQQAGQMLQSSGDQNLQQAGQSLQQAGNQLQNGNAQAAAQQMNQASQQAQQAQNQASQSQQSAEQMSQQSQQINNAANQINQTSQNQQPAQSQSQQSAEQMSQSGTNQDASQSTSSQSSGSPNENGNAQSNSGSPQSQGAMGEQGSSGSSSESQQAGETSGDGSSGQQLTGAAVPPQGGAGAGNTSGAETNTSASQGVGDMPSANNNPDGTGERSYDLIYAPSRIGGELGEDSIFLEDEDTQSPVIQGEFTQNNVGSSTVPYNQVYSSYANAANQALESGYVPLGLRDVIRNYFLSLTPSGGESSP